MQVETILASVNVYNLTAQRAKLLSALMRAPSEVVLAIPKVRTKLSILRILNYQSNQLSLNSFIFLCVSLPVFLCGSLRVCVHVCLFICLCLFIHLSIYLSLYLFVYLFVCVSLCVSTCVCLFICLFVCLCVSLTFSLSTVIVYRCIHLYDTKPVCP